MSGTGGSSIHDWINSIGVGVAILGAAAASWFAYHSANLKAESLSFATVPDYSCRFEHQRLGDSEWVGLCWAVTIKNVSEDKTSVTAYSTSDINGTIAHWDGLHTLELPNGGLPLVLDGGDSKSFLVRVPVKTPASVTQLITAFVAPKVKSGGNLKLSDVVDELAKRGLDVLGNSVTPIIADGKVRGMQWTPDAKGATGILAVTSVRGHFQTLMAWPPQDIH
jgi:hypothetical protein